MSEAPLLDPKCIEEIRYIERSRRAEEKARRFEEGRLDEGAIRETKPARIPREAGVAEVAATTTRR